MNIYQKHLRRLSPLAGETQAIRRAIIICVMLMTALAFARPVRINGQQAVFDNHRPINPEKRSSTHQPPRSTLQQPAVPLVDHHTHILSLNASSLVTEPLMPVVELPEALRRLLQDKEQFGGKEKNPSALADLYTKDALVLNPAGPLWLRGEQAISYVTNNTEAAKLLPTAYEVDGSSGYIAGYEADGQGESARYLSNFIYVIKKGADGKWRIASEAFTVGGPPRAKEITAEQLVSELDAAGVKRAAVLSVAYWFGNPRRKVADEYAKVRAENDWLAEQVARHRDRLVGFCSFNPLRDYAIEELNRCIKNPNFKGLKLHVGNSRLDVLNPEHVEKLRNVFRAANAKRFPILIHLWTSTGNYGRAHAEAFLKEIIPAAPDTTIQIAHMAATGPNYHSDDAFEVYAQAAASKDPRMKNVYVDVAGMVTSNTTPEVMELVARRLRQFGLEHVLFASDRVPGFGNEAPKDAWTSFRRLPLTEKEFRTVVENVAPYMR